MEQRHHRGRVMGGIKSTQHQLFVTVWGGSQLNV